MPAGYQEEGARGREWSRLTFRTFLFHSSPPTRTLTVLVARPAETTTPVRMLMGPPGLHTRCGAVTRAEAVASVTAATAVEAIGALGVTRSEPSGRVLCLASLCRFGRKECVERGRCGERWLAWSISIAAGRVRGPRWAGPASRPQISIRSIRPRRHRRGP